MNDLAKRAKRILGDRLTSVRVCPCDECREDESDLNQVNEAITTLESEVERLRNDRNKWRTKYQDEMDFQKRGAETTQRIIDGD